jgi:hypothetical protein
MRTKIALGALAVILVGALVFKAFLSEQEQTSLPAKAATTPELTSADPQHVTSAGKDTFAEPAGGQEVPPVVEPPTTDGALRNIMVDMLSASFNRDVLLDKIRQLGISLSQDDGPVTETGSRTLYTQVEPVGEISYLEVQVVSDDQGQDVLEGLRYSLPYSNERFRDLIDVLSANPKLKNPHILPEAVVYETQDGFSLWVNTVRDESDPAKVYLRVGLEPSVD